MKREKKNKKGGKETHVCQEQVELGPRDRPQPPRRRAGRDGSVKVDLEPLLGPFEDGRGEVEVVVGSVGGGGVGGGGSESGGGGGGDGRRRRRSLDHRDGFCC